LEAYRNICPKNMKDILTQALLVATRDRYVPALKQLYLIAKNTTQYKVSIR